MAWVSRCRMDSLAVGFMGQHLLVVLITGPYPSLFVLEPCSLFGKGLLNSCPCRRFCAFSALCTCVGFEFYSDRMQVLPPWSCCIGIPTLPLRPYTSPMHRILNPKPYSRPLDTTRQPQSVAVPQWTAPGLAINSRVPCEYLI